MKFNIGKLDSTIYVQIWENRIKAVNLSNGKYFDEKPLLAFTSNSKGVHTVKAFGNNAGSCHCDDCEIINPFSHPRSIIANFTIGEKLLQLVFKELFEKNNLLKARPRVIVHPREKLEAGLTQVEERALKELAIGAGARDTKVYVGIELAQFEIDFDKIT